ncbi:MAG: sensor histidine kinase [Anaerovoracaceae bacterium]
MGSEILNGESFWNFLSEEAISGDFDVIQRKPVMMVKTADDCVWNFRKNELKTGKYTVFEIIAYDVTAQYHLLQLLDEKIKRLAAVNERLREYGTQIDKVIREREILSAKIKVHNEAGRTLMAFRAYLEQPKHERNREKLLSLWRYNLAVMRNDLEPQQQSNEWELLLDAAEAVDVEIVLNGELPEDETVRKAVISAVHECLTNTVRHAGGKRLDVDIVSEKTVVVSITNTGAAPSGEIQETGGLVNLRSMVDAAGGTMTILSRPRFKLQLEFVQEEVK